MPVRNKNLKCNESRIDHMLSKNQVGEKKKKKESGWRNVKENDYSPMVLDFVL